jgi:hypothetical protein
VNPPLAPLTRPDEQGVAGIMLNRPDKKNALSIALRDEVTTLVGGLSGDQSVKALVITGSGGNFSAGFDLREFSLTEPGDQQRLWESSDAFHHAVYRFPLPVVAAVDGIAYGGGFDLLIRNKAGGKHPQEGRRAPRAKLPVLRRLGARRPVPARLPPLSGVYVQGTGVRDEWHRGIPAQDWPASGAPRHRRRRAGARRS